MTTKCLTALFTVVRDTVVSSQQGIVGHIGEENALQVSLTQLGISGHDCFGRGYPCIDADCQNASEVPSLSSHEVAEFRYAKQSKVPAVWTVSMERRLSLCRRC